MFLKVQPVDGGQYLVEVSRLTYEGVVVFPFINDTSSNRVLLVFSRCTMEMKHI